MNLKSDREYIFFVGGTIHDDGSIPITPIEEIVRCKDCVCFDPENHHCDNAMGTAAPLRRELNDFCSYGRRKTSD